MTAGKDEVSKWDQVVVNVRRADAARSKRRQADQHARDADECRKCKQPPIVARLFSHPEARDPWRAVFWCDRCQMPAFGSASDAAHVAAAEIELLPLADVGARARVLAR